VNDSRFETLDVFVIQIEHKSADYAVVALLDELSDALLDLVCQLLVCGKLHS
jgi:hypothetical protein